MSNLFHLVQFVFDISRFSLIDLKISVRFRVICDGSVRKFEFRFQRLWMGQVRVEFGLTKEFEVQPPLLIITFNSCNLNHLHFTSYTKPLIGYQKGFTPLASCWWTLRKTSWAVSALSWGNLWRPSGLAREPWPQSAGTAVMDKALQENIENITTWV